MMNLHISLFPAEYAILRIAGPSSPSAGLIRVSLVEENEDWSVTVLFRKGTTLYRYNISQCVRT